MAQSTVKLIVDAQNAIRPLQRVNEQTKALSSNTDKLKGRLDKSNRSLKDTGRSAKTAAAGFGTLTKSIAPLLKALAVISATRFVLFQTAQLETQTKALEVLTGSAEKAQKIVQEIKEFGAVTPFKSSDLIEVTKRLKAFGFETENVVDITKRVADIAGTAGADINNVALAIGKVQAKNKFMQEENVMLLEKGINVTKELEKIMNMNGETLAKAMSKGEVGADKFVQALINLTSKGGEFFEGASKQSDTLAGKFSTLVDNVETFAQNLGKMFNPAFKFILDELNKIASEFNKIFAMLSDAQIGASNRNVGSAAFKARFGMQEDAVADITKAVNLLDPTFVKTEQDAAKLFAQLDRISKVMTLVKGPDSAEVLDRRGLLDPLIEANKQMDDMRDKVNATLKAQKQGTIQTEKNKEQVKETATTFTELISSSDFLNTNLGQSNIFMESISNGTEKLSEGLVNVKSEADQLKEKFMEIGQGIEDGIVSGLTDAVMGTQTLAQAAIGVLNDLKRKLVEVAMQRAVSGIGNFFGNALSGIFGGGNKASKFLGGPNPFSGPKSNVSPFLGFANGGRPPIGRASIVGERGPELFVPRSAGTIIPNNAIGGGVTNVVTVNVDAKGSSVAGNGSGADALGQLIGGIVQQTLVKEQRAGGLLNR